MKNAGQTHEAEYEMVGTQNQQEAVRLPIELLLHLVVHAVRVIRRQLVHDKLLRQLNLITCRILTTLHALTHMSQVYMVYLPSVL